eukprot:gene17743-22816_t
MIRRWQMEREGILLPPPPADGGAHADLVAVDIAVRGGELAVDIGYDHCRDGDDTKMEKERGRRQ